VLSERAGLRTGEIDLTPDRPGRAGIGNVARALGGDHPSDAAAILGASCD
jgi:hypothetical protein